MRGGCSPAGAARLPAGWASPSRRARPRPASPRLASPRAARAAAASSSRLLLLALARPELRPAAGPWRRGPDAAREVAPVPRAPLPGRVPARPPGQEHRKSSQLGTARACQPGEACHGDEDPHSPHRGLGHIARRLELCCLGTGRLSHGLMDLLEGGRLVVKSRGYRIKGSVFSSWPHRLRCVLQTIWEPQLPPYKMGAMVPPSQSYCMRIKS